MRKTWVIFIMLLILSACLPKKATAPTPMTPATLPPTPVNTISVSPEPTRTPSPTALPTPYPPVPAQVASGDYHTCYLSPGGQVACWGWNKYGQSGANPSRENILPGNWIPLGGLSKISSGAYHSCAVDVEGKVFCWGRNNNGQLGNGTYLDSSDPVLVTNLDGIHVSKVACGSFHTCAYEADGRAWCWGSNRDGKLGAGSSESSSAIPLLVLSPVAQVSSLTAGATFTCASGGADQTWCWGEGSFGQTGRKLLQSNPEPRLIDSIIPDVVLLTSGWFHTCALTSSGNITCWGKNYEGALGNSSAVSRGMAALVTGISNKKAIRLLAAGGRSTCAVTSGDQLYCWGKNDFGQVGNGKKVDQMLPAEVSQLAGKHILSLSVGASHVCTLTDANEVYCWGANDHGQLGLEISQAELLPVIIPLAGE